MPLRPSCSSLSAIVSRYSQPLILSVCTLRGSLAIPVSIVLATLKIIADTVTWEMTASQINIRVLPSLQPVAPFAAPVP
jgi:hypothetical protein